MIETDVIVVGSGPAGSSAAKHAALGGAKVILMDKKSEIGSPKRCAEDDKMVREELDYENKGYKKFQEYVYSLSDEEMDEIGHALEGESFDEASSAEVVKKLIKISPKASLYLGKFV